jgi:hypothetical protein
MRLQITKRFLISFSSMLFLLASSSSFAASKVCTSPIPNHGLIFGTVVSVQGFTATVQFSAGSTCANTAYLCGDMRRPNVTGLKEFFGIISAMVDLGKGKFAITNDCPVNWPPRIGETIFLIYKKCGTNYCPTPGDSSNVVISNPCVN